MMSAGVKDVRKFDFLERPHEEAIEGAFRQLKLLGAIGQNDNALTPLGKRMAAFPLDPKFTKIILTANELGCTYENVKLFLRTWSHSFRAFFREEVVTIVSILSGESILVTPQAKREEAAAARKKFFSSEGDHLTYLKMFRAFKSAQNQAIMHSFTVRAKCN